MNCKGEIRRITIARHNLHGTSSSDAVSVITASSSGVYLPESTYVAAAAVGIRHRSQATVCHIAAAVLQGKQHFEKLLRHTNNAKISGSGASRSIRTAQIEIRSTSCH